MFCLIQVPSFADCEGSKGWSCRIVAAPHCSQKLARCRPRSSHRHLGCATEDTLQGSCSSPVLSQICLYCERFRAPADHKEEAGLLAVDHAIGRDLGQRELPNGMV